MAKRKEPCGTVRATIIIGKDGSVKPRLPADLDYRLNAHRLSTNILRTFMRLYGKIYKGDAELRLCSKNDTELTTKYRIAGNFRGRKLSRIGRKGAFCGENFKNVKMSLYGCGMPIISWRKLSWMAERS